MDSIAVGNLDIGGDQRDATGRRLGSQHQYLASNTSDRPDPEGPQTVLRSRESWGLPRTWVPPSLRRWRPVDLVGEEVGDPVDGDSFLRLGVALSHRDRVVGE